MGSPPHARGKAAAWGKLCDEIRITPARAGKRGDQLRHRERCRDHPRTRGEKCTTIRRRVFRRGSPPHARGKAETMMDNTAGSRITPARAGKSIAPVANAMGQRDHPRTRGEKCEECTNGSLCKGSPPHARGKGAMRKTAANFERITPARAGKRTPELTEGRTYRDHPRTRGEKSQTQKEGIADGGSPPHARGKETDAVHLRRPWGITPARAGKSLLLRGLYPKKGDHPRTRGEKILGRT